MPLTLQITLSRKFLQFVNTWHLLPCVFLYCFHQSLMVVYLPNFTMLPPQCFSFSESVFIYVHVCAGVHKFIHVCIVFMLVQIQMCICIHAHRVQSLTFGVYFNGIIPDSLRQDLSPILELTDLARLIEQQGLMIQLSSMHLQCCGYVCALLEPDFR